MTTPQIRDIPRATTPDTISTVLGNLGEEHLLGVMGMSSSTKDLPWLRTMVAGGLVNVKPDLAHVDDAVEMRLLCEEFGSRVKALSQFTSNVTMDSADRDPELGVMPQPFLVAKFKETPEFVDWFKQTTSEVLEQHQAFTSHPNHGHVAKEDDNLRSAMGHWMVAAAILDLPNELKALAKAAPEAVSEEVDIKSLGQEVGRTIVYFHDDAIKITPLFAATALSRPACQEVLQAAGSGHRLGSVAMNFGGNSLVNMDISLSNVLQILEPPCEPRLLRTLATAMLNDPEKSEDMRLGALAAASQSQTPPRVAVAAFVAAGALDNHVAEAIPEAVANGHVNIIERFRSAIPWERMQFNEADSPIIRACAKSKLPDRTDNSLHSLAIVRLLDQAVEDGRSNDVLTTFATSYGVKDQSSKAKVEMEPIMSLARVGFTEAITRYLQQGLELSTVVPGNKTLIDRIGEVNPDVAQSLKTWSAAAKAREELASLHTLHNKAGH